MDTILIVAVIMLCYVYWQNSEELKLIPNNDTQTYINLNVNDLCQESDKCLAQCQVDKDMIKTCQENFEKEKQKNKDLMTQYGNKEPNDIDFLYYGGDDYPLHGDDKLVYKMYDMGLRSKQATINRTVYDKYSLVPYFEEELRNHSNSIWWDDDTLDSQF